MCVSFLGDYLPCSYACCNNPLILSRIVSRFRISCRVCLCDTFVIVGGVCLTATLRSGSAALLLRTVRIAALGRGWSMAGTREASVRHLLPPRSSRGPRSTLRFDVSDVVAAAVLFSLPHLVRLRHTHRAYCVFGAVAWDV